MLDHDHGDRRRHSQASRQFLCVLKSLDAGVRDLDTGIALLEDEGVVDRGVQSAQRRFLVEDLVRVRGRLRSRTGRSLARAIQKRIGSAR